jgi:hypothetical protein
VHDFVPIAENSRGVDIWRQSNVNCHKRGDMGLPPARRDSHAGGVCDRNRGGALAQEPLGGFRLERAGEEEFLSAITPLAEQQRALACCSMPAAIVSLPSAFPSCTRVGMSLSPSRSPTRAVPHPVFTETGALSP